MSDDASKKPPAEFPQTPWSLIAAGANGDIEESREALRTLLAIYWEPVYATIRGNWEPDAERAAVLCEQFLRRFLYGTDLADSVERTGRFRDLVRERLDAFMQDRNGDGAHERPSGIDIKPAVATSRLPPDAARTFDECWMLAIFNNALDKLRDSYRDEPESYAIFAAVDVDGDDFDPASLADRFSIEKALVAPTVREARRRLRRFLTDAVHAYANDQSEALAELRWLLGDGAPG
ncbi:MAG: hypothetical protein AAFX44_07170 [Pseudomonadota bacterium]